MASDKVNLLEKFSLFSGCSNPRIAGEVNDSQGKPVKLKGEFLWRHHENQDEWFLVVNGKRLMRLRDREARINAGEFFIAPKGVEHGPVAEQEAHIGWIEPKGAWNTGNVGNEKTLETLATI